MCLQSLSNRATTRSAGAWKPILSNTLQLIELTYRLWFAAMDRLQLQLGSKVEHSNTSEAGSQLLRWRTVTRNYHNGNATVLTVLKGVRCVLLCMGSCRSCAEGVGEYALCPEAVEVTLPVLEVLEGVRCVFGAVKNVGCVLYVLEVVLYMLKVVNGVRCVLWVVGPMLPGGERRSSNYLLGEIS